MCHVSVYELERIVNSEVSEEKKESPPIHEIYHGLLEIAIDEKGLEIPQAVCLREDGNVELAALAVTPEQAYKWVLCTAASDTHITDIIMGVDRYTKPGQGNEFGDTIAGVHWTRVGDKKGTFRGFVVDYQFGPPKIVRPVNYDNAFWNEIIKNEFQHCANLLMQTAAQNRLLIEQGGA